MGYRSLMFFWIEILAQRRLNLPHGIAEGMNLMFGHSPLAIVDIRDRESTVAPERKPV